MTDANGNTWLYEYTTTSTTIIDPLGRRTTSVQTDQYLPSQTINPEQCRIFLVLNMVYLSLLPVPSYLFSLKRKTLIDFFSKP